MNPYLGAVVGSAVVIAWTVRGEIDYFLSQFPVKQVVQLVEVLSVTSKYSIFVLYLKPDTILALAL